MKREAFVERILVIQLKRLGDFILTAPALMTLRQARPAAELVVLTLEGLVELAACLPGVNRVMGYQQGAVNWEAWASALAGTWDCCLDFTGTDRSAALTALSRARRRIGYEKFSGNGLRRLAYTQFCKAAVRELHTVDFHLALVAEALGEDAKPSMRAPFVVSAQTRALARSKLSREGCRGRYVMLHPGTARLEKFWVEERWVEVARHVRERMGLDVVLTGTGKGLEEAPLRRIRQGCDFPLVDLTGKLSLVEMVAVIEGAALMVGVDSMAMHLAALLGKPQVALFGPTNPFHWRGRHGRSLVLQGSSEEPKKDFAPREQGRPMNEVSTSAVIHAMTALPAD